MRTSFLLLFAIPSVTYATDPPSPNDEVVAAVKKAAAAGAEVHGIGIGAVARSGFGSGDLKNWPQFVELLRRGEGPAGRIWDALPPKAQELAANDNLVSKLGLPNAPGDSLRLGVGIGTTVSSLLTRHDFYTEKAFKDVPLDENLKAMLALGEKRTRVQTIRMNRELLARAFPDVVTQVPTNYYITPVQVKAGKPVILVLASSPTCQWQIEMEEGAEVVGVILCGIEPQEVAGVKAPIVYRAAQGPDGKRRENTKDVIPAPYARDQELFPQFEEGVKKITGKTFATFQGTSNAPKESFIVNPNDK